MMQLDDSENRVVLAVQVPATDFIELEKLRQRLLAVRLTVQFGSAS